MSIVIKILIADDRPVVRQGIRQIVASAGDMVVADEVTNGRTLVERGLTIDHDVVLLDLEMPGSDVLQIVKQLKQERPKIPLVILTMCSEGQLAIRALKAGAAGYLTRESAPAEVIGAIRKAVAGGRYLPPRVAEKLGDDLTTDAEARLHDALSDREYQVLRMIAAGKATRHIAEELALSVKTVSTYRTRIFDKMGMKSPAELAAYVVRNGLSD
jgi:DNA-binding NarL/FixJ family response regulator